MTRQRIEMALYRPETTPFVSLDDWHFEPRKWWRPLQRAAWWFLRKTGGVNNAIKDKTEYRRIVIDTAKVGETIMQAIHEANMAHIRPNKVYMGPAQIDGLMSDPDYFRSMAPQQFDVRMGFNRSVFGLPVQVVPWMDGVLVVAE